MSQDEKEHSIPVLVMAMVFFCVGLLFQFLALFFEEWKYLQTKLTSFQELFIRVGLYEYCFEYTPGSNKCAPIENPEDYIIGTRALIGMAIGLTICAVLLLSIHIYKVIKKTAFKGLVYGLECVAIFTVLFLALASIVYDVHFKEPQVVDDLYRNQFSLGTSFTFNIVGTVLIFTAALLVGMSYYKPQEIHPNGEIVFGQSNQIAEPQTMPPHYGQTAWGQPAFGQSQLYYTNASGQLMPPIG